MTLIVNVVVEDRDVEEELCQCWDVVDPASRGAVFSWDHGVQGIMGSKTDSMRSPTLEAMTPW